MHLLARPKGGTSTSGSLHTPGPESPPPSVLQRPCPYCAALLSSRHPEYGDLEPWNRLLFRSRYCVVAPTLGAIVEGWLLVISRDHCLSVGSLPSQAFQDLRAMVEAVVEVVARRYGPPTVFEHGPAKAGLDSGCGVDHAHVHVVPLPFSLGGAADRAGPSRLEWQPSLPNLGSLPSLHRARRSYLYLHEPQQPPVHSLAPNLPCQFLRRVIAREVGIPGEFDYHVHSHETNVRRTIDAVAGALSAVSTC
ncbi:MAG: HIT domain-containing protein [Deltaproteobacteria bacterium]|nr:HIT domain-containing protein [Deltaproteobacteria bacterium]